MAFKLKTSKKTEEIFNEMEGSINLPWYTLVKLAMALSLKKGHIEIKGANVEQSSRDLNRQTITGDADVLYKCLIELVEQKHITDDEFFPGYVKAHIDRGAQLLYDEYKYCSNAQFLIHLTELDKGI